MNAFHGGVAPTASGPTWSEMLTAFEILPALAVAAFATLYILGVRRLRRRGDKWSWGRTASYLVGGLGSITVATQGPLAYLDAVLLSTHMIQHMILTMVAPVFIALGAPLTLALRTLPGRPRQLILSIVHSRYMKVITFPLFAGLVFVLNPWVLYFTDLYELTLTNSVIHNINHVHFLVVGVIWVYALVGIDPMPRMGYPLRLISVFITLPFHAFLGVTMMSDSAGIARDYYESLGRTWGMSVAADQELGGGLLWAAGDIVGLLMFTVLVIQWARASDREAVRIDRELDRQEALQASPSTTD